MAATIYTMPSHVNGDTFEGLRITLTLNGSPIDLTSGSVIMTVLEGSNEVEFSTGNGKMSIINPSTNGIVELNKQVISFSSYGTFSYEMKFILSDGTITTFLAGTWTITRT